VPLCYRASEPPPSARKDSVAFQVVRARFGRPPLEGHFRAHPLLRVVVTLYCTARVGRERDLGCASRPRRRDVHSRPLGMCTVIFPHSACPCPVSVSNFPPPPLLSPPPHDTPRQCPHRILISWPLALH